MVLNYDSYIDTIEEKNQKSEEIGEIKNQIQQLFDILKGITEPKKHTEAAQQLYKSGLIHT